jgi:hypothetical protein
LARGFHLHHFDEGFASAFQMLAKLPGIKNGRYNYVCQFDAGNGLWLAAAERLGVQRVLGIASPDGPEQPPCIDPSLLKLFDLRQVKVSLPQAADLVICIDFAQKLSLGRVQDFISDLCHSAPQILFSAPTPYGSSINDENLQWPSYWAAQFAAMGFYPDLPYRQRIWPDRLIDPLLRQNSLLFVKRSGRFKPNYSLEALDVVHPAQYQALHERQAWFARQLTRSTLQRLFGESIDPRP